MTKGFKRKLKFIGLGFFVVLTILYLGAQFWMNYRLEPFLDQLIKDGVSNSSDSLYSIRYQSISFNIPTRTLTLKEVDMSADTLLFAKRKANGVHVPTGLLSVHLKELKITHVEFFEAWANKGLEAGSVIIENPVIAFTLYDTITRRDTLVKAPVAFDLYKLFSEEFHSLTVQNIQVKNASFRLYKNSTDTAAIVSSNGIQIAIGNLKIDSAYSANRYEIDLASKIKVTVTEAHWILPDSIYRMQLGNMSLDATKQSLSFEKIEVVPLAGKYKIAKIEGYETDQIQMKIDSLALQNLDMNLLLYNHSISCRRVQIQNIDLKAFRYKGAPTKRGYRLLPVEQLRAAPLMVHIDSVRIMNGRIEYAEQIPGNSFSGTVFFDRIASSITNINNDSISLRDNSSCTISAEGRLMGKGKLNVKLAFDQISPVDSFTFEGAVGKLELTLFNPLILQSAHIKLETGTLDDLAFTASGTNESCSGRMTFMYHDLAVEMSQNEKDESGKSHQVAKKNIVSFLANTLAIVSENPKDNITRNATLYQKRNTEKYIFNYLWQTILSGVKETVMTSRMKRVIKNQKK
jgi:hypothetical protein